MATLARQQDFIEAVASELASGIDSAVQCWMMQFEAVLDNPRLTTSDQMQALREILHRYKVATGKTSLECMQ